MSDTDGLAVLVVDPDDDCEDVVTALTSMGPQVSVREANTVETAITILEDTAIDCIVTEYALSEQSGLALVEWVRDNVPDIPCILFTDQTPGQIQTAAFENVIVEYLPKDIPDATTALVKLVENVTGQHGQLSYPIPDNEDERLAAIKQYDVPGLLAADTFDRLTELVATHFDVNVAFAGVVDAHEERFFACHGADWESLDRENSICTHTILQDDSMVVEDVQADTRFGNIPELADLNIRSYAGVPLKTPGGLPIGALCLIHDEPRSYDDADIETLQLFADELMEQLELRRRLAERPIESGGQQ
jgi:CheY-like chemotaxis protein